MSSRVRSLVDGADSTDLYSSVIECRLTILSQQKSRDELVLLLLEYSCSVFGGEAHAHTAEDKPARYDALTVLQQAFDESIMQACAV